MKKIYWFVAALLALVPLGLLSSNPAWGEWEEEYYQKTLGFIPKNIQEGFSINAPFSDYTTPFLGEVGSYYFSAVVGVVVLFGIYFLLYKVIKVEKTKR